MLQLKLSVDEWDGGGGNNAIGVDRRPKST